MKNDKMQTTLCGKDNLMNNSDFFGSRYYILNKQILSIVGLWPFQSAVERAARNLVFIFSCIRKCLNSWGNTNLFIECLMCTAANVGVLCKLLNAVINMKKLKQLLEKTQTNWESCLHSIETSILEKCGEKGRSGTIYYITLVYSVITVWCLVPLIPKAMDVVVPLNHTRTIIIVFPTDYKVDPDEYFYPILLHGSVVCAFGMLGLLATDTLYMATSQHACGMFEIMRYHLENIIEDNARLNDCIFLPKRHEDISYQQIIACIESHRRTVQYIRLMESSYEWALVLVLGFSLLLMSCTGSRVVAPETSLQDSLRFAGFTFAQVVHLYCNTLPGQWVMDASTLVPISSYNTRWYIMSRRSRGLILIILRRTATPCTMAAGKLYVMSMENFSSVLQTAMSYFTLLTSMQ